MATTEFPDIHTQAGARWLAPFLAVVLAVMFTALLMMINPHLAS